MGSIMFFLRDDEGLTTVEYAIVGALVSAVLVAAFPNLGGAVAANITDMRTVLN